MKMRKKRNVKYLIMNNIYFSDWVECCKISPPGYRYPCLALSTNGRVEKGYVVMDDTGFCCLDDEDKLILDNVVFWAPIPARPWNRLTEIARTAAKRRV